MMQTVYWLSLVLLYYVYDGYLRVLQLLALLPSTYRGQYEDAPREKVTVLVTAHNEAMQIVERIRNILDSDFPAECLEVLVASDGSTDGTDDLVTNFRDARVRLFRPALRGGKTATQNQAISGIGSDIIVFTDADTRFDKEFLRKLCAPFRDPTIGAVTGRLLLPAKSTGSLAASQGFYWAYELKVRTLESRLGLLAVASGACLAVRKPLFIEMDPAIGEDCIVPLDVVVQRKKVVHAQDAVAHDKMDSSTSGEFRARVRMTARNWRGTWARSELLNPLRHPGYAFALWSHKLLRWLSPFFLLVLFLAALTLGLRSGGWLWLMMLIPGGVVFGGAAGWVVRRLGVSVPGLGTLYSFCVANLGFFFGALKAWFGKSILVYK